MNIHVTYMGLSSFLLISSRNCCVFLRGASSLRTSTRRHIHFPHPVRPIPFIPIPFHSPSIHITIQRMALSPNFEEMMKMIDDVRVHLDELHAENDMLKAETNKLRHQLEKGHALNEKLNAVNQLSAANNEGVQAFNRRLCEKVKHLEIQLKSWHDYAVAKGIEIGPYAYCEHRGPVIDGVAECFVCEAREAENFGIARPEGHPEVDLQEGSSGQ